MTDTDHKDAQGISTAEEQPRAREESTAPRKGTGSMLGRVAAQVGSPVLARKIQRRAVQRKAAQGFTRMVPASAAELTAYFGKMAENAKNLKSAGVNLDKSQIEIDWDSVAHFAQYPSVFIPIKRGKGPEAQALVAGMRFKDGFAPSSEQVGSLFALIDAAGK